MDAGALVLSLIFGALFLYGVIYYAVLAAIREAQNPSKPKRLRSKDDA